MKKSELIKIIKESLTFDISTEVKIGDIVEDGMNDQYKVVSISTSHVELKPLTFMGDNTIFPKDLGKDVSIEEFWVYFT